VSRGLVVVLILICTALNGAGFLWHLFEPIPLYGEIAHFLIPPHAGGHNSGDHIPRRGEGEFFNTPRHAVITGPVIGVS
jgi:hypothetical protein